MVSSEWSDVISEIPQETILGPILFMIYINDTPDVYCVFVCWWGKIIQTCIMWWWPQISPVYGLNALQEWSDKWLLKLNASKCKTVFYGRNIDHGYKYSLHSAELANTSTINDLEVIFDPELSFSHTVKKK